MRHIKKSQKQQSKDAFDHAKPDELTAEDIPFVELETPDGMELSPPNDTNNDTTDSSSNTMNQTKSQPRTSPNNTHTDTQTNDSDTQTRSEAVSQTRNQSQNTTTSMTPDNPAVVGVTNDGTNLFLDHPNEELAEIGLSIMSDTDLSLEMADINGLIEYHIEQADTPLEFAFNIEPINTVEIRIVNQYEDNYGTDRIALAGDTKAVKDNGIKADWDTTHHDFNYDDKVWEIDADSLGFVLNAIESNYNFDVELTNETDYDVDVDSTTDQSNIQFTATEITKAGYDVFAVSHIDGMQNAVDTNDAIDAQRPKPDTWHVAVDSIQPLINALS